MSDQSEQSVEGKNQSTYLDWNNSMSVLDKAFEKGLFVLIIGPKGTGKTSLVREYAIQKSKNLESINFSLRTRESHLVGTKNLIDGNVGFDANPTCKGLFGLFELNEFDFSQLGILGEQFLYFSIQFSFIG